MFCPKCNKIVGDENFCPECGTPTTAEPKENTNTEKKIISDPYSDNGLHSGILVCGIMSIALSLVFCIGSIFGVIAIINYVRYQKKNYSDSNQASIGFVLAIIGLAICFLYLCINMPKCF